MNTKKLAALIASLGDVERLRIERDGEVIEVEYFEPQPEPDCECETEPESWRDVVAARLREAFPSPHETR